MKTNRVRGIACS